jgi:hypothetical protein
MDLYVNAEPVYSGLLAGIAAMFLQGEIGVGFKPVLGLRKRFPIAYKVCANQEESSLTKSVCLSSKYNKKS